MDINEIQSVIPHRYPFLLIDRIIEIDPFKRIVALKNVSINEPYFNGHFPHHPVMPGVLILEALAQTGAIALLSMPENSGRLVLFGGVRHARFRRQVTPGDVLTLSCELAALRGSAGFGKVTASVEGQLAAEAEISFVLH